MKLLPWTIVLGLLGMGPGAFALDRSAPSLARDLAATCANCHGTDGQPVAGSGSASLAGMEREELLRKLRNFRTDAQPASIMQQIAKGYSEAQLELIAAYFANRK